MVLTMVLITINIYIYFPCYSWKMVHTHILLSNYSRCFHFFRFMLRDFYNVKRCTRCKLDFIISKRNGRGEKITLYSNLQTMFFKPMHVRYYCCAIYILNGTIKIVILTTTIAIRLSRR